MTIVYVDGEPMLESDRNMEPPWRVYPDDLVAAWAEAVAAGPQPDDPLPVLEEERVEAFIVSMDERPDFEMRVNIRDLRDLFGSLRRRGYAVGNATVRLTSDGIRFYQKRMKDVEKVRPKVAAALRGRVRLVAY